MAAVRVTPAPKPDDVPELVTKSHPVAGLSSYEHINLITTYEGDAERLQAICEYVGGHVNEPHSEHVFRPAAGTRKRMFGEALDYLS